MTRDHRSDRGVVEARFSEVFGELDFLSGYARRRGAHLNYTTGQNLPQVDRKLASMGIHERLGIQMASGAATTSGPVTCAPAAGGSAPTVKVLVGSDGTEVIGAGQSAGNTAQGSFHMVSCALTDATTSGNTGAG